MDSIRVSEAPDPGSILGETTNPRSESCEGSFCSSVTSLLVVARKKRTRRATAG